MSDSDAVFVDTSGWIALLNADDSLHDQAAQCLKELAASMRPLTTTDWVLAETGNGLARVAARDRFVLAVERFLQSGHSRLVRVSPEAFQRALDLYGRVADKTWGLVDCASFVVMQHEGIRDALTVDRHFQPAGFRCLLKAP
jgi:predicted nucleic acid-binding protein